MVQIASLSGSHFTGQRMHESGFAGGQTNQGHAAEVKRESQSSVHSAVYTVGSPRSPCEEPTSSHPGVFCICKVPTDRMGIAGQSYRHGLSPKAG